MPKTNKKAKTSKRSVRKVAIAPLRKQISAFLAGYRKHPKILNGITQVAKAAELKSAIKKLDNYEAKEEKIEKELSKLRKDRQSYAIREAKRISQSRKIARAVLSRLDGKDFL